MNFTCSELRSMFWSEMQRLRKNPHNGLNTTGFEDQWPRWREDAFDAEKFWPMSEASCWLGHTKRIWD